MGISIKKIKQNNEGVFLEDVKRVRQFAVFVEKTSSYLMVRKSEVMGLAEIKEVRYYITDKIFVQKRNVMVIC